MSSSVASSPVLFDSPPPGLEPAPLRIPDRKSRGSDDANDSEFWGTYGGHHAPSPTLEEPCLTPPPSNYGHPVPLSHRRVTSNKLDSLVSKFEILDAVNNTDEEVTWLPRHSTKNKPGTKEEPHHLSPPRTSSLARKTLERSTSSQEKASTAEESSDLSPLSSRPKVPARRSNLPPTSHLKVITAGDVLPPVTPSKHPQSLTETGKDSAFKSTKSLLDPAAFRVNQPDLNLVGTSPRRLPTSRSANKASPMGPKSPGSFRSAIAALNDSSASNETDPKLTENHGRDRGTVTKSGCNGKPSVADLRESFEKMSHITGSKSVQQTPTKKKSMGASVQQSGSSSREKSGSTDSGLGMVETASKVPAQESSKIYNTPPSSRAKSPLATDGLFRTPTYHARARRTPVTGLPTSKGSRQRQAMLTKSRTTDLSSIISCSAAGSDEDGDGRAAETFKDNGLQGAFPSSGLVCSTQPSDANKAFVPSASNEQRSPIQANQNFHEQAATMGSLEGNSTSNMPFIQPIPVIVRPISRPSSKSDPTTRRTAKVADLRRLFDRPSFRRSSPTGLVSFARRHQFATSSAGPRDAPRNRHLAEYTTSSNETSSYKQTSPPELTTEISLNDFSCRFSHDQDQVPKPSEVIASAMAFGEETGMLSSISRASFHDEPDETESDQDDSPLKRRIKHFEHLQISSNPKGLAYGRAKSHDANLHAAFKASCPERKTSKAKNGQWLRERGARTWRRISNSLNISTDGGNDTPNRLYRGESNLETFSPSHRDISFGFSLHRMSTPFHLSLIAPHNTPTHYREYSSEASHEAMIAELKSHSSYLSRTRSSPATRPPKHLLPLYAARKSRAVIRRFTSSSNRSSEAYDFGLDGGVESKPSRQSEAQLFANPNQNIESSSELLMHPPSSTEGAPLAQVSTLPTSGELAKKTIKDAKKATKEKERETKAAAKAAAKETKSKQKGKQKARFVSLGSSRKHTSSRKPTPHPNILETSDQSEASEGAARGGGGNTKPPQQKQRERSWGKITASGFMVRQAKVDELHQPKPQRPGQVKKIVNMYKEKSTSLLRIVSGNQSTHSHHAGRSGTTGESSGAAAGRQGAAAGSSWRRRWVGNTDGEGYSAPRNDQVKSKRPHESNGKTGRDEKATSLGQEGGGEYDSFTHIIGNDGTYE
ncbi:hypothetical protein PG987_014242 [Apiospora arundinis]